jgi:hypothetical protein
MSAAIKTESAMKNLPGYIKIFSYEMDFLKKIKNHGELTDKKTGWM